MCHPYVPSLCVTPMCHLLSVAACGVQPSEVSSFLAPPEVGSNGVMKFLVFNDVGMVDPVLFVDVCNPLCRTCPGSYCPSKDELLLYCC
jgi:hypothetical protein